MPAVEVLTEYVRACRRLGHDTPDPIVLLTSYTAEQSLDLGALAADCRTLSAAAAVAEEALTEQERAQNAVLTQWHGVGGDVAADFLRRHADAAVAAVGNLRCAATALRDLTDRLRQLVEEKVDATTDIEARGVREVWLGAARTVTTGAGDRSTASELVDQQVAPFVATDIAGDWVLSMRSTERSIRDAYRSAADAVGAAVVFTGPGRPALPAPVTVESTAVQPVSYSSPATVPAGFSAEQLATPVPSVAPAAVASPVAQPVAPPETPAAASLPPGGGVGAMPSPAAGLSGLSGLGQPFADMLGGLFGSGASGLSSDPFGVDDPFDARDDAADEALDEEDTDTEEEADDEGAEDEQPEDDEPKDEEPEEEASEDDESEAHGPEAVTVDEVPLGAAEAAPVATPVPEALPEPPVDPAAPVAPPPATPCEIAADALPQAGP
ncbi:hypothetical protein MN2019_24995 [Mycolicibacterium neoaurum]|uniref:hypothetical protein n=1 Tax=Mycolicibacterium neoaurum TaxID=1795 RepID=UPI001BCF6957|nr:hypothetical protein [Mycolicibacterium neoaurum]QVI27410.1 hypothetical protein MN2019_24995 [Mycolicibacterium neoaurum]